MRILIADDEKPARSELRYILENLIPTAVFFETTNGGETLEAVEKETLDVIFLDINMPEPDGLEIATIVMEEPEPPLIVFATAYSQHALRAFELAAVDYVVKPFDEQRLEKTVERLRHILNERTLLEKRQQALRQYLAQNMLSRGLTKLWGERENENRVLVDYREILWLVAQDKKVYMRTRAGETLRVNYTLKELATRLQAHNFLRVHKSYIVNIDHIAEVAPWFSGTYIIRMDDENRTEIPLSRRYAAYLKRFTDW